MKITEALVRLRDDLKKWATNNLVSLDNKTRHISDDGSDELVVSDSNGNSILQVNKDGVTTTTVNAKGFSSASEELAVADGNRNVILRVNESGVETTKVTTKRLTSGEPALEIADGNRNIIFRLDSDGIDTVGVKVNGVEIGGGSSESVLYTEQTLTEEQQAQARSNIGAVSADDIIVDTEPTADSTNPVASGGVYTALQNVGGSSESVVLKRTGVLPGTSKSSAVYGDGMFVAVGWGTQTAYSEDGVTWTASTLPQSSLWHHISYGNGKYIALSSVLKAAAYSEDGINWSMTDAFGSDKLLSSAYGNGKYVVVGYAYAYYSEDCVTWTTVTMPTTDTYWKNIAFLNDRFVALTNDEQAAYSEDGITWTEFTLPSDEYYTALAYGNGKYVAIADASATAAHSEDCINWTATTTPCSNDLNDVVYAADKFVAVGIFGAIAYSEDGITWTDVSISCTASFMSVDYDGEKFVAVPGKYDAVYYSTDGITWALGEITLEQNDDDVTEYVALALEPYIAPATALILTSPGGTRYQITVDDTGTLSATEVTE